MNEKLKLFVFEPSKPKRYHYSLRFYRASGEVWYSDFDMDVWPAQFLGVNSDGKNVIRFYIHNSEDLEFLDCVQENEKLYRGINSNFVIVRRDLIEKNVPYSSLVDQELNILN